MGIKEEPAAINAIVLTEEDEAAIDEAIRNARDPEDWRWRFPRASTWRVGWYLWN